MGTGRCGLDLCGKWFHRRWPPIDAVDTPELRLDRAGVLGSRHRWDTDGMVRPSERSAMAVGDSRPSLCSMDDHGPARGRQARVLAPGFGRMARIAAFGLGDRYNHATGRLTMVCS